MVRLLHRQKFRIWRENGRKRGRGCSRPSVGWKG